MPELSQQHVCWSCCYRETCCKANAIHCLLSSYQQQKFCPLCADSPTKRRNLVRSVFLVSIFQPQNYFLQKTGAHSVVLISFVCLFVFLNSVLRGLLCLILRLLRFSSRAKLRPRRRLWGLSGQRAAPLWRRSGASPGPERLCPCAAASALHSYWSVPVGMNDVSFFKLCCEFHSARDARPSY